MQSFACDGENRLDLGDQGWNGGAWHMLGSAVFVCVFAAGYSSDKFFQLGSRD